MVQLVACCVVEVNAVGLNLQDVSSFQTKLWLECAISPGSRRLAIFIKEVLVHVSE